MELFLSIYSLCKENDKRTATNAPVSDNSENNNQTIFLLLNDTCAWFNLPYIHQLNNRKK